MPLRAHLITFVKVGQNVGRIEAIGSTVDIAIIPWHGDTLVLTVRSRLWYIFLRGSRTIGLQSRYASEP